MNYSIVNPMTPITHLFFKIVCVHKHLRERVCKKTGDLTANPFLSESEYGRVIEAGMRQLVILDFLFAVPHKLLAAGMRFDASLDRK